MGRPVSFDFTTGGGSPEEFLMGVVYLEPTLMHTIGSTVVLPDAPYPVKLVNGKAVHPDVAVSPAGPEPAWAYRVTIKNELTGKSWSEFRGVPTGTTQIAYKDLTKFVTTIPPQTTAGMMQNWADTTEANADRSELAADRAEAPTDEMNKTLIENPASLTSNALSAAIADKTRFSLAAGSAVGVSVFTDATRPYSIARFGGYLWGNKSGRIWRSLDGTAWTDFAASPDSSPVMIIRPVDGGEVLASVYTGVYKSSGWSTGSVTWTKKISLSGPGGSFQPFNLSATGSKAIASEYGANVDSRYAWISLDAGNSWTIVYNAQTRYTAEEYAGTHIHGVEYDPWSDRFYLSEGHGAVAGIYVSSDNGATWTRPAGLIQNPSPTTLTATDDGLVCGSDSSQAGLFGIVRQDNLADETYIETWRWRPGISGVIGFGVSGHRDPDTGVVYVAFRSAIDTVAPVIAGGTAGAAGIVYEWPTLPVALVDDIKHAIVLNGRIFAHGRINGADRHIIGNVAAPGIPALEPVAKVEGDSLQIGPKSALNFGTIRSTAVGILATATGDQDSTAVGYNAKAAGLALSVGVNAIADLQSTSLGNGAKTIGTGSTAVGTNAQTTAAGGTTVGEGSKAGTGGVAFGMLSESTGFGSSALVYGAKAIHANATVLAASTSSTTSGQVKLGIQHVEMGINEPSAAPGANLGRFYFRKDANGKVEFAARFPTGVAQAIASEVGVAKIPTYVTGNRPSAADATTGTVSVGVIRDSTLNKLLFSDGTVWRDAMGTAV